MNSPLTPSPSVTDLSKDLETLEIITHDIPLIDKSVETSETKNTDETLEEVESNDEKVEAKPQETNDVKEILSKVLSLETVTVLENHELLDWDLLNSIEFKDISNLGLKMATFLKLRHALKGNFIQKSLIIDKFPVQKEMMVPLSKIEIIVQNILDSKTSGIPKPNAFGIKSVESLDSLKKTIKKPGKYDNVKSKVAQQWNKTRF